jgi:ATP sulfurylase
MILKNNLHSEIINNKPLKNSLLWPIPITKNSQKNIKIYSENIIMLKIIHSRMTLTINSLLNSGNSLIIFHNSILLKYLNPIILSTNHPWTTDPFSKKKKCLSLHLFLKEKVFSQKTSKKSQSFFELIYLLHEIYYIFLCFLYNYIYI